MMFLPLSSRKGLPHSFKPILTSFVWLLLSLSFHPTPCRAHGTSNDTTYESTWESLDARPLPKWYSDAKIGIFIHWGVFSVPSFKTEWFWQVWQQQGKQDFVDFVEATENTKHFNYPDYAHRFDATLYNPEYWAKEVFAKSGAQYIVLTSKHHEGYCMFDSRSIPTTWNWNVMDIGPRRDLLGELATAIRKPDVVSQQTNLPLKFGVYHSLFEWFNPIYVNDQVTNNFTTQHFVDTKTMPELYHLIKTYEPELVWSDGISNATSEYWKSTEFLAWLANNSTVKDTVVWNDRWGRGCTCKHGSFYTCRDGFLPDDKMDHYFENAFTLDNGSWGWNRAGNVADYMTTKEVIVTICKTISRNGNVNINIGPAADGTISPIMVDRLLDLGKWLKVNGKGVYETRPWKVCNQDAGGTVFYTRTDTVLYAHVSEWPAGSKLELSCPEGTDSTTAVMLGLVEGEVGDENSDESLRAKTTVIVTPSSEKGNAGLNIRFPLLTPDLIPCQHVWVIALRNIENLDDTNIDAE